MVEHEFECLDGADRFDNEERFDFVDCLEVVDFREDSDIAVDSDLGMDREELLRSDPGTQPLSRLRRVDLRIGESYVVVEDSLTHSFSLKGDD